MIQNKATRQTNHPSSQTQDHQSGGQPDLQKVYLFIGPVLDSTTNSSVESYLLKRGLKVAVIDRKSTKKRRFLIAEVDKAGSIAQVADFLNTDHFIDGQKMGIRKYSVPKSEEFSDLDRKIYVGNLPRSVTKDEVKRFFDRYGAVSRVFIKKKIKKIDFAFAFITFEHKESAEKLRAIQVIEYKNKTLYIKTADQRLQKKIRSESGAENSSSRDLSSDDEMGQTGNSESAQQGQKAIGTEKKSEEGKTDQELFKEVSRQRRGLPEPNLMRDLKVSTNRRNLKVSSEPGSSHKTKKRLSSFNINEAFDNKTAPGRSVAEPLNRRHHRPAHHSQGQAVFLPQPLIRLASANESLIPKIDPRRYDLSQEEYFFKNQQQETLQDLEEELPRNQPEDYMSRNPRSFDSEGSLVERSQRVVSTNADLSAPEIYSFFNSNINNPRHPQPLRLDNSRLEPIPEINNETDRFYSEAGNCENSNKLGSQRGVDSAGVRARRGSTGYYRGRSLGFQRSWGDFSRQSGSDSFDSELQAPHELRRERVSYGEIFADRDLSQAGRETSLEYISRRDSSRPHFWRFFTDVDQQLEVIREDRQIAYSHQPGRFSGEGPLKQLLNSAKLRRISISHHQEGNMRFNVKADHTN